MFEVTAEIYVVSKRFRSVLDGDPYVVGVFETIGAAKKYCETNTVEKNAYWDIENFDLLA